MAKDEERIANDDLEKLIPNCFRCANQESPKKLNLREHSQGGNACAYSNYQEKSFLSTQHF